MLMISSKPSRICSPTCLPLTLLLNSLYEFDGKTEILPQTPVSELKEIPWRPMVVTVAQPPAKGSAKKQMVYKGMSTAVSCRKDLDRLALKISCIYDFETNYRNPTIGDVLHAKDGQQGKPETSDPRVAWWDYRKVGRGQGPTTKLPDLLTRSQWDFVSFLNHTTSTKIHDGESPQTSSQKSFVIFPHEVFTDENVQTLRDITFAIGETVCKEDLVVKDEYGI